MPTRPATGDHRTDSPRIGPDDPRYRAVVEKRFNKRFRASPDYVRLAGSTEQVIAAVEEAVREGRRLVVTSGGHCLEGFVSDPEVRVIIDVSPMKRIYYDAEHGRRGRRGRRHGGRDVPGAVRDLGHRDPARRVSGDRHGRARGRRRLRLPLPPARPRGGLSARRRGGHRGRGADGRAAWWRPARRPTRNRDLWWAHTGGGGGNFGVVTRYWFRSPGASGDDPAQAVAPRAGVDHDLQGGMELERHRPAGLPAAPHGTTGPGASATAAPTRRTRRSGPCSSSIASSSERSSSAA